MFLMRGWEIGVLGDNSFVTVYYYIYPHMEAIQASFFLFFFLGGGGSFDKIHYKVSIHRSTERQVHIM